MLRHVKEEKGAYAVPVLKNEIEKTYLELLKLRFTTIIMTTCYDVSSTYSPPLVLLCSSFYYQQLS